ncbi:MAG: sugar isomerase [Oscillospiraceae bacterium]|nr:sugar isomerase [Oscillospiraceae bacterium]
MYDFKKIVLGVAPTRRDVFPPPENAIANKAPVIKRLREIFTGVDDLDIVDIDCINDEGILSDYEDVAKTEKLFRDHNVDAVFMPHLNFGQEEVVGKLGHALKLPFLLWGPRDPCPKPNAPVRDFDVQCGLFASSKALSRYGAPFTYIENCWLDAPILEKGISDFVRVASTVRAFKQLRILQLSTRPRQFLSVKVNESELLEKFGIEVAVLESTEIINCIDSVLANREDEIKQLICGWEGSLDVSGLSLERLKKIAAIEIGVAELASTYDCSVVSGECWQLFVTKYGVRPCFVFGDLTQKGLPVSCENDIHGSITSALLLGATRMQTPTFLADVTIRHPDNDNAELLWHCGPFPSCLAREGARPAIRNDGIGWWELKHGDITIARFDAEKGKYSLFADEGYGVEGPETDGNYIWMETPDWIKREKKLIYGPYIHHVVGAHGKYKDILHEACKYLGDIMPDSVD